MRATGKWGRPFEYWLALAVGLMAVMFGVAFIVEVVVLIVRSV